LNENFRQIANKMLILKHKNNLYSSYIFFASSNVNWTSVKVSLQRWDLPLTINISLMIKWMWVKTLRRSYVAKNTCSRYFWQKMKSWWRKDTDQNISAKSLTMFIFAVGWALCGQPQPENESVMPLLSLLNVLTH